METRRGVRPRRRIARGRVFNSCHPRPRKAQNSERRGLRAIKPGEPWVPKPSARSQSPQRLNVHKAGATRGSSNLPEVSVLTDVSNEWVPRSPSLSPQKDRSPTSVRSLQEESLVHIYAISLERSAALRVSMQARIKRAALGTWQTLTIHRKLLEGVGRKIRSQKSQVQVRDAFETWRCRLAEAARRRHLSLSSHAHASHDQMSTSLVEGDAGLGPYQHTQASPHRQRDADRDSILDYRKGDGELLWHEVDEIKQAHLQVRTREAAL